MDEEATLADKFADKFADKAVANEWDEKDSHLSLSQLSYEAKEAL